MKVRRWKVCSAAFGKYFPSNNPATEEQLTEIAAADEVDVDNAVAARRAYEKFGARRRDASGANIFVASRASSGEVARAGLLETMDGGKTIKESRDVDLRSWPRTSFYYAGWADKLKYAFRVRRRSRSASRARSFRNFPLLMALEDRARARLRQHRRSQTGGNHFHHRTAPRRDLP
jgi:aldehyde dehydrogenase (NAD+)